MPTSDWAPNPSQQRAVEHGTGPLRILAGAGSGKTTTLVHRIASLVERGLCRAEQILVLTFTTKAVEDLRRKVAELLGTDGGQPRVETYHAFALGLVREFAEQLGLPPDPVLLTEAPLKLLMRQQVDRLGLERQDLTRIGAAVEKVVGFSSWHRHEGTYRVEPSGLLERLDSIDERACYGELLGAFEGYRALLREKGAVDYDDLIALAVGLLEGNPGVLADVQARYPFLLVDEYQDTDFLQGEMVRLLAGSGGNITIVGDPDQTIYSFRGAAMTNIRDFHALFPDVADVIMVTNYRSTPEILAAANLLISRNQRRKADLLVAHGAGGPRPQLVEAPDWPAEARWLAQQVDELRRSGGYHLADMAILVRRNKDKADLFAALVEAGIPVQVVGGMSLFDDPEALRCTGYIRALANPADDEAVAVALSMPRYGLTDRDIAALARQRLPKERLLETVGRLAAAGDDGGQAGGRLRAFVAEFWPLYQRQFTDGCHAAVQAAIALHAGGFAPDTRAGVEQLLDLAQAYFAHPELFTEKAESGGLALFAEYLEGLRTVGDRPLEAVQFDDEANAVKLMTMHAAKGLEFPVVFLPRLALSKRALGDLKAGKWDKPFPLAWHHDREFAENAAALMEEEERRLHYVAVTRAREQLYLSWAQLDPARKGALLRSPFLDEMEDACDAVQVGQGDLEAAATGSVSVVEMVAELVSGAPARAVVEPSPVASPGPQVPAVLSFSHLSTYQLCPF
ncbi:MAG TPA: ATP-dependent helicase, partial [Symbiobacteriaceae bacterium]|nr:ATP-dependent helicase [Symbiobacteriaceae bacterium]